MFISEAHLRRAAPAAVQRLGKYLQLPQEEAGEIIEVLRQQGYFLPSFAPNYFRGRVR